MVSSARTACARPRRSAESPRPSWPRSSCGSPARSGRRTPTSRRPSPSATSRWPASPPEAEKKAADAAASAATAAGADKYAPGEFSAMTAAMRKAETEMSAKAYKEAKISYESAKVLAEQAVKAAESGKTAARAAAEKQIAEVQGRWKDLAAK